jgi:phosphoribosylanthranilate isomerase
MTLVKICGITRIDDAMTAASAGADLIGFVFAPSPRRADPAVVRMISERLAKSWPRVGRVGVFVDPTAEDLVKIACEASLTHLQIHGTVPSPMPADPPWIAAESLGSREDAARIADAAEGSWALLVDARDPQLAGGTGRSFPWEWAAPIVARRRVIIAGGLDAERVGSLLEDLAPFGVDASSRLESLPGIKDPEKVRAFIRAVRRKEGNGA